MFKLGDIYDLPELKTQAYVNVLRQCEFGCSSPEKPIDLCAAIRYLYKELRNSDMLIDAVINYCVSCFLSHRLAEDPEFKRLAYEHRPFHQGLCKNVMARRFENESKYYCTLVCKSLTDESIAALAIIQMPFKSYIPDTYASREDPDLVYHFHGADDVEDDSKKAKFQQRASDMGFTLPLRPRGKGPAYADRFSPKATACELDDKLPTPPAEPASSSTTSGLAQLLQAQQTPTALEQDYEMVQEQAAVGEPSDDDSDSDGFVPVKYQGINGSTPQSPVLVQGGACGLKNETTSNDSDSDSEWAMI
jgi:hypothetical protein